MAHDQQLHQLGEAARLNSKGAVLLQSGDGNRAMKALRSALVILGGVSTEAGAERFNTHDYQCYALAIPSIDEDFYAFDNALMFDASPRLDLEFSGAIILFNMALALHQKGMKGGKETKLRQALSIYNLCLQQINGINGNAGCLRVAVLNNRAQIFYQIGDYESAVQSLQALQHQLNVLPLDLLSDPNGPFKMDQFEQFMVNIATTQRPGVAPAA